MARMSTARRKAYLDAIGIEPWALRARSAEAGDDGTEAEPAPASASAPTSAETAPPRATVPEAAAVDESPLVVAEDWDGLAAQARACSRCGLCETRTQAVFGVGAADADLVVVGEGPGADEDRVGEPFVGRAGKLLDEMLAAIGRSRSRNTYIANVVKCRPPGNRDPSPQGAEACRPYLEQQLKLLKPKLIVAVGRIAAQRLLESSEPLARLRGQVHHWGEDKIPVWVTYHPAYLLRSPREKAKSWADLKQVHRLLHPV